MYDPDDVAAALAAGAGREVEAKARQLANGFEHVELRHVVGGIAVCEKIREQLGKSSYEPVQFVRTPPGQEAVHVARMLLERWEGVFEVEKRKARDRR